MVLETLSDAYDAEMHPGRIYLHGMLYAIIGIALALWTFPGYASVVSIFFTSIAAIPLIYAILKVEEDKDFHETNEKILIKEHSKAVIAYFMLFLGILTAQTLAFILLPEQTVIHSFQAQIETYQQIAPQNAVLGYATQAGEFFVTILLNNIRVLVLAILFSFAYGAGAIFILTWNASVIALAIGNTLREAISHTLINNGVAGVGSYLALTGHTIFLRYGIHGSLEIAAYIIAALAGGIISVATIRKHYQTKEFEHIVMDSADLIIIATGLLVVSAGIEAYITPLFY